MKPLHIVGIVVIAVAIGSIVATAGDASTYATFSEIENAEKIKTVHIVGTLPKDQQGNVLGIDQSSKLSFTFDLVDRDGLVKKVFYNEPMPADFLKSEQVVVIGKMKGENFHAEKILMKCPSKYQEENPTV